MSIFVRHILHLSAIAVGSTIMLGSAPASAATSTSAMPVAASGVDASMAADAPAAVWARRALAAAVRAKLIARHVRPGRNLDAVIAAVARAPRHLLVPQGEAPKASKSYGSVMFVDFTGAIERSSRLWRFRRGGST